MGQEAPRDPAVGDDKVDAALMLQLIQLYQKYSWLLCFKDYSNSNGNVASLFLFSVLPHFSISIEPKSNFIGYKDFTNFEITIRAR